MDPFITTHFGNRTGISTASNVQVPLIILDTEPPDTLFSLNGDLLFILSRFDFQYAVHPRVALRVAGGGASRIGTSSESIFSQGVTAAMNVSAGTTIKLLESERVLLSFSADVVGGNSLYINLAKYVADIIDDGVTTSRLLQKDNLVVVDAGLRVGWAPGEWYGLTTAGRIGHADHAAGNEGLVWGVGMTMSADFGQRGNAPIGLSASVSVDQIEPRTLVAEESLLAGLGVYYTGRDDLNLGVEVEWVRLPLIDPDITVNPVTTSLVFRYFF